MFEKYQKKFVNLLLFVDLTKMQKKVPYDQKKAVALQNKRVQKLVKKAYQMPFYKKRFDKAGVKPSDIHTAEDLSKLPLLTKDELREWMKHEEKKSKYQYYFKDTTSGSSGVPLMVLFSPREKAYMMANWFRVMLVAGYNPFLGKTMSRRSAHSITGGKDTVLQRFGILRRGFVNQYDTEAEMVKQINAYKPEFLYMNKTEFMRLCLYCKQNHVKLWKPKFYTPTGEKIDDTARKLFREILGPGIIDSYGTAEAGACMVKLFDSQEYTIHQDSFAVNIYDDEGHVAKEGKIVVTPLYKTDVPLINYVVGDKGVAKMKNGIRTIGGVQGRMNDFFRYESGEVTTFFEIAPIIAHCTDVLQIRFIQESYDEITIQCVHNEAESKRTTKEAEEQLATELQAKFKHPFKLTFQWMKVIPPDPNGKLRMIVCNVK